MTAYALGMSLLPHARTRVDMATLTCTWTFTFAFACSDGAPNTEHSSSSHG